jgi:hypothetical protein
LNPDQRESIALLSGLRHSAKELEELVKVFEGLEVQAAKDSKKLLKDHSKDIFTSVQKASTKKEEELKGVFSGYVQLIRELDQLDPEDTIVSELRGLFLCENADAAFVATQKVFKRSEEIICEGVSCKSISRKYEMCPSVLVVVVRSLTSFLIQFRRRCVSAFN